MLFEWDTNKNESNIKNHDGVSFHDAEQIFYDDFALEEYDAAHSDLNEQRFNRIGTSKKGVLFVVYTVRGDTENERIRIISARFAEKFEENIYWEERRSYE